MAKIEIISTANSVQVDFGAYNTILEMDKGVWRKSNISFILRSTYVEGNIEGEKTWKVGYVEDLPNRILKIDKVDTVPPTSLSDLYDKLAALLWC